MSDNSYSHRIAELEEQIRHFKSMEASLRESREMMNSILQKSFAAIYVVQNDKFCNVNAKVADYTGYAVEELLGMKADSIVHPEDQADVLRLSRAMLRGDSATPYIYRIVTKGGDVRWIVESVSLITYEGRPARLGNCIDITEHRKTIQDLQNSENLYRTIFETTLAATIIVEENTIISLLNSSFVKMSGYSREEWEGKKSWTEFVVPEDRQRMIDNHHRRRIDRQAAPRSYEFGLIDSRGEIRNVLLMVDMIPNTNKSVASFIDITEHKHAVARLEESENLYRAIFENTGAATFIVEQDTTVCMVNSEFVNITGYVPEEWEGKKSWTEFVAPEDRDRMIANHHLRRIDPQIVPKKYEFHLLDARGCVRNVILMVDMIPGTSRSIASFADITEHKLAAARLKESENLYRTIFENTGTATIIVENDMTISLANTEFGVLTGAPKEKWEGKNQWTGLFKPKDMEKIKESLQERAGNGGRPWSRTLQCEITDRQGSKKVVLISSAAIPDSWQRVVSLTDITAQKKTEGALRAREREIQKKSRTLEEMNAALKVLLKQREDDRLELEENVLTNVHEMVLPNLTKLRTERLSPRGLALLNTVESSIVKIISPFSQRLQSKHLNLTQREMEVANFVREGKSTKEISELLSICTGAVSFHRDNLRKKLGLNNKKINLKAHLDAIC